VAAFSLVTGGHKLDAFIKEKWAHGEYADYFLWHGFGAELTEALAEYIHFKIRQELGLESKGRLDYAANLKKKYRGRRLSPGYPSFPQLEDQKKILELLKAEAIGVSLTENFSAAARTNNYCSYSSPPRCLPLFLKLWSCLRFLFRVFPGKGHARQ